MTIDINNLTGNESLEELEALLNDPEVVDGEEHKQEQEQANTEEKVEETATTAAEGEQAGSTDSQGNEQQEGSEQASAEKVVLSKDGKNVIPYEVLAQQREETKRLREENEQLRAVAAERDKLAAKLEKEGIPLTDDQIADLSPEQLEELAEDYPGIAPVIKMLSAKLNAIESTSRQSQTTPATNPVEAALNAVPDLVAWKEGDEDRFAFAVTVDQKLQSDPAWKDKPLNERFSEAAKRTRAAFGDAAPAAEQSGKPAAGKEPPSAKTKIPDSPSDIGGFNQAAGRLTAEALEALPQEELMAKMATMSSAQIEELLSQNDY